MSAASQNSDMSDLFNSPQFLLNLSRYMGDVLVISELGLLVSRRSRARGNSEDKGSLFLLWITIIGSMIAAGFGSAFVRATDSGLLTRLVPLGIALFVLGLVLRWYAIVYLGRFFTVDVAIASDHRIIDTGPYRLMRHPSYTGLLLAFLGLGICFRNWLGLLFAIVPTTTLLLWRIRIEEAALTRALGDAYLNYSARTRRLIPFVY
jgi:protein-S-isoprenylcysteine O-methyltransferase